MSGLAVAHSLRTVDVHKHCGAFQIDIARTHRSFQPKLACSSSHATQAYVPLTKIFNALFDQVECKPRAARAFRPIRLIYKAPDRAAKSVIFFASWVTGLSSLTLRVRQAAPARKAWLILCLQLWHTVHTLLSHVTPAPAGARMIPCL